MAGLNIKAAGILDDISHGYGLVQAAKKNEINSQKELDDCAAANFALSEKLTERWGQSWKSVFGKASANTENTDNGGSDTERDAIIAELKELKIGFHPNTGIVKLKEMLENAKASANTENTDNGGSDTERDAGDNEADGGDE